MLYSKHQQFDYISMYQIPMMASLQWMNVIVAQLQEVQEISKAVQQ